MAIARVQFTQGGNATPATPVTALTTSAFGSSLTVGNWIAAFVRWANAVTITQFDDTAGNTFTNRSMHTTSDPRFAVYTAPVTTGGAGVTLTVDFSDAGSAYCWIVAVEYSGVDSFGAADKNMDQSATTDLVSTAITTSIAGTALVLSGSQPAFATYSAGTDFTLIDGTLGSAGNIGGVEEYIPAGTLSSYVAHLTSDTSATGGVMWTTLAPPDEPEPPVTVAWITA